MIGTPTAENRTSSLLELCEESFSGKLIVVSNRGPLEYHISPEGDLQPRRGSGSVVTALSVLTNNIELTWVSSAMGDGDRRMAENSQGHSVRSQLHGQRLSAHFVVTTRRMYHKYYNILCNPLLWFLQHYMWSPPYTPNIDSNVYDAWENGYVPVNKAFAQAVAEEAKKSDAQMCVMIHDYHLYLVPEFLRAEVPNILIQHFIHIPWPNPTYWQLLPAYIRNTILRSLCKADVVGFQTNRDARSFLESCKTFLPEAVVDYSQRTNYIDNQTTMVKAYPLSINVEEVQQISTSPRAQEHEKRLKTLCGEKTIVRVDRTEPSKNIIRGFKAFETLLKRHPELQGRVKFLAFLVPSRTHIRQYERYLEETDLVVNNINNSLGSEDWKPITVFYENNYTQAIASMRLYDILIVNPIIDGMNLVAKEGPVVNTKNGVLILTESAGAYEQLTKGSLGVGSADIEGTMQAMYQALTMSQEERQHLNQLLVDSIKDEDVTEWLFRQLQDLKTLSY